MQMDKSSTIGDAITYIEFLQKKIKETGVADISAPHSYTIEYSGSTANSLISRNGIDSAELVHYEERPAKSQDQPGFKILEVLLYTTLYLAISYN
jgi:hypothetical protein